MNRPFALIVEDDTHLGLIFDKTLQRYFETEIVADGNTAITRLKEIVPHLIILDLNLPGRSGKDILRRVRNDPRFESTHIFLCTADARQAEMLRNEADIVLLKPVSPSLLREMAVRFMKILPDII